VPTELSVGEWEDAVAQSNEYVEIEDHSRGVELVFDQGVTYQLKLSKVGVGTGVEETETAYLTSVEDLPETPFAGQTYPFEVESRDKYNNPVRDNVVAGPDIPNGVVLETGRYRYQYTAPSDPGQDEVRATYSESASPVYNVNLPSFDGQKVENVQYDVAIQPATGGGGPVDPGDGDPLSEVTQLQSYGKPNEGYVRFSVTNEGSTPLRISGIKVTSPSAAGIYETRLDISEFVLESEGAQEEYESNPYALGDIQNFDPSVTVEPSSDLTVSLSRFRKNNGNVQGMNNKEVSVTFYYSDPGIEPTTKTFQVDPNP
jgi:hypothetical protein